MLTNKLNVEFVALYNVSRLQRIIVRALCVGKLTVIYKRCIDSKQFFQLILLLFSYFDCDGCICGNKCFLLNNYI